MKVVTSANLLLKIHNGPEIFRKEKKRKIPNTFFFVLLCRRQHKQRVNKRSDGKKREVFCLFNLFPLYYLRRYCLFLKRTLKRSCLSVASFFLVWKQERLNQKSLLSIVFENVGSANFNLNDLLLSFVFDCKREKCSDHHYQL